MATEEVKAALREHLDKAGITAELISKTRCSIWKALHEEKSEEVPSFVDSGSENKVVLDLFSEWLSFNTLRSTLSVLRAETGLPSRPIHRRAALAEQLGVQEDSSTLQL
eukprot:jgi/Astpho2/8930/Aster-x0833